MVREKIKKFSRLLPKTISKRVSKKVSELEKRFETLEYLLKENKRQALDDVMFSFESLPRYGKEYWFLMLTGEGKKHPRQLIAMFGRTNRKKIGINDKVFVTKKLGEKVVSGTCDYWYYDGKKHCLADSETRILLDKKHGKKHLSTIGEKTRLDFSKDPDCCRLSLRNENQKTLDITLTPTKHGKKHDLVKFFKGPFGYENLNIYLDFEGKLNNKKFKGKGYLQKVFLVSPFVPWQWTRILFEDGSIFSGFSAYLSVLGREYKIAPSAEYYDKKTKKLHRFKKLEFFKNRGKHPRWIIVADDGNKKFYASIKTYSRHELNFSSYGKFTYTQHLVETENVFYEEKNKTQNLSQKNHGTGIVEDARGLMI